MSLLAALATSALALLPATQAEAQIQFTPCGQSNTLACGHLAVPLDPADPAAGTITLAIRRHRAPVGEARTAVVALAGGPGQPAIPFAEQFAELLGPIAATRDLIVFDQRGTGLSNPLSCHAFERSDGALSAGGQIASCAAQLGASRDFYTTADTVADIEAIRQAGGYEKLVLYGTSYGTRVAEQYAQAYPSRVEALVLDSVVPPNGPDTLNRPTFAALPRVLRQICRRGACRGITANPVTDLRRLLARMRHRPLRMRGLDARGHAHTFYLTPQILLDVLLAGDFSDLLRADFVTTVRAAADGDTAPLARLLVTVGSGEGEEEDFDSPLYYATTCQEQDFPWSRAASPAQRLKQAIRAARALPASTFAPFTAQEAIGFSDIVPCASWPFSEPAPALDEAPFPAVPTLILSGADDLRTPTSNALEVAREISGSHLLVVPFTGHSVLGDDPSDCSSKALQALFSSGQVKPCKSGAAPAALRPQPLPPLSLARVSPARGSHGLTGRTAHGIELTIADLRSQLALTLAATGSAEEVFSLPSLRTGGLRSGWARLQSGGLQLHDYSFIPGLTLSGTIKSEIADLRVGGSEAAHGTLRLGAKHALIGRLDGQSVHVAETSEATAAILGTDARASSNSDSRRPLLGRVAGALAGVLAGRRP